jgi:hypothetical protein
LSKGPPGLLGSIVARAEAQTIRLALLYALLDQKSEIDVPHLQAASAVWRYCEQSACFIFGEKLGNPVVDKIFTALVQAAGNGLTRTDISRLFSGNRTSSEIVNALHELKRVGKATSKAETTGGKPVERWFATVSAEK